MDEEALMMAAMGLPTNLATTKGKHVEGNGTGEAFARVKSQRRYRQYMFRKGGFNQPLESEKTGGRRKPRKRAKKEKKEQQADAK